MKHSVFIMCGNYWCSSGENLIIKGIVHPKIKICKKITTRITNTQLFTLIDGLELCCGLHVDYCDFFFFQLIELSF